MSKYEPSPVPSDSDLWPGEKPFTAWGQHKQGTLDLRVFDQGAWWVDIEQHPHRLTGMSEEYLSNVIDHLTLYNREYYLASIRRQAIEDAVHMALGRASGNVLAREAGGPSGTEIEAEVWLEATPLMRALRAQLRIRGRKAG